MNDITVLALLVSKAKASAFTMEYISQFETSDIDSDDVDLRFEVDGVETGTNVSIVDECGQAAQMIRALVEALEKAQRHERLTEAERQAYLGLISQRDERIAELESRTVTVKLPDEVLKLAQAPQHLSKHDQLCWMSGANWMRMEAVKLNPAAGIQVIEGEGQ